MLVASAQAQAWSVQTAQFPDYRSALDKRDALRERGFDAYIDFATEGGRQFSRVRVGCFENEAGAAELAQRLQETAFTDLTTSAATVVEASFVGLSGSALDGSALDGSALGGGADTVLACAVFDVGFRLPPMWGVNRSGDAAISFWVELDEQRRYLRYSDAGWQIFQEADDLARVRTEAPSAEAQGWFRLAPSAVATPNLWATFSHVDQAGTRWVRARLEDASVVVVTSGDILWQHNSVAVVQTGEAVVAISLRDAQ